MTLETKNHSFEVGDLVVVKLNSPTWYRNRDRCAMERPVLVQRWSSPSFQLHELVVYFDFLGRAGQDRFVLSHCGGDFEIISKAVK